MLLVGMWFLTFFSAWRIVDALVGGGILMTLFAAGTKTKAAEKAVGKGCLKVIGTLIVFGFFLYIGILGITSL